MGSYQYLSDSSDGLLISLSAFGSGLRALGLQEFMELNVDYRVGVAIVGYSYNGLDHPRYLRYF